MNFAMYHTSTYISTHVLMYVRMYVCMYCAHLIRFRI